MRYKRRNPDVDPRLSEPDIYIIDPTTGERRVMRGDEAANYAVVLQGLIVEDPINYDKERTRASLTWHINHALRMGYDWDTLKARLSKAKRGERGNPMRKTSRRKKNLQHRNGGGWYSAAQNYLTRLGVAEYEAQAKRWVKAGRSMSTFRYSPTSYHRDLVELLGKGDEEGFKARKNLEGYSTALKA